MQQQQDIDEKKSVQESVAVTDLEAQQRRRRGKDEATKVLANADNQAPITETEEQAVLRKIDWRVMPMLLITTGLQYADKSSLSTAALFGLIQAMKLYTVSASGGLDTYLYSQVAMIFSVGYIAGVLPLSALAQRLPTGRACALYVVLWGIVVILTPLCKSFEGIMVQRFFLGFMESGVSPAFLSIMGMWYTKREQALRAPVIYSANGFVVVPLLLMAWGIVTVGPEADAWQNLFWLIGALTIAWGVVVFFVLPDDPIRASFLNERERYVAIERLRSNQAGVTSKQFQPKQAAMTFLDIKVVLLAVITFCVCAPSGAVGSFSSLVIQRVYGASPRKSLLLLMPSGVVGGFSNLFAGYIAFKLPNARCFAIVLFSLICMIGSALEWKLPLTSKEGVLAGLYLMSAFSGALGTLTGLAVSNVAGASKKTVVGSLVFLCLALANIASPFFFLVNEQPRYPTGFKTTVALLAVGIGLTGVYYALCRFENKKRDSTLARDGPSAEDHAFSDMTDIENKAFRYTL